MNCPRCQGCLARDWAPNEANGSLMRPVMRCINCGHRNDLVYNLNRQTQMKGAHSHVR